MNNQDWAEMHGETNELEKEIYHQTVQPYNFLINDHVDYEVLVEIRLFTDGTRICEVQDELLKVFDDEGTMKDEFSVTLPSKYVKEALEKAEDYEQY